MGANDREQSRKEDRRNKAADAKKQRIGTNRTTGAADWQEVNADKLINAIACIGRNGGALRFGYSRDGGAYALGVYDGGDVYTLYDSEVEVVHAWLEEIIVDYGK